MKRKLILIGILSAVLLAQRTSRANSVVVFNEIHYHPVANETALEWLELFNQMSVDVDLSGWSLENGVSFVFPEGTVIRAGGYRVVASSPQALASLTGLTNILGPFARRLSNTGDALDLRNLNSRLMDSMHYGVGGDWPTGPDGSGVTLAKRSPNLASATSSSWTSSAVVGGTPGGANFSSIPPTGVRTVAIPLNGEWRYQDDGIDLGTDWSSSSYDDTQWKLGAAPFHTGDISLPLPKATSLVAGRGTYYFRRSFTMPGAPAKSLLSLRTLLDDGASVYINGIEAARLNLPTNALSFGSFASSAVGNPSLSAPSLLLVTNLQVGLNQVAVELHQANGTTNENLKITPSAGYRMIWDGNDGDYSNSTSPALAPSNDALASRGAEVFASSNTNAASKLNDGQYGTGSGWSPANTDINSFILIRFPQIIPVNSLAWGRDNGDSSDTACGGTCTDRALGTYTVQYTLAADPLKVTTLSTNPTNDWATVANVRYLGTQNGFSAHLRHRFDLRNTNGSPILATGIRLRASATNSFDEIEINPPAVPHFDAAFALELTSAEILPPPAAIAFNEITAGTNGIFVVEMINHGPVPVNLSGVRILSAGTPAASYTFAEQTLAPGDFRKIGAAELGFSPLPGSKLFLFAPGQFQLLDAVTVGTVPLGRFPNGTGNWMTLDQPTLGGSNVVRLHDEIVINEVMHHAAPMDPVAAVTRVTRLLSLTNTWRYNDTGGDLGSLWHQPDFDDSGWAAGAGLFGTNNGTLPAPVLTLISSNQTTRYFRTRFTFQPDGGTNPIVLQLHALVDDGAVFYLNGVELYRENMPKGTVLFSTPAASRVGDPTFHSPVMLSAEALVAGENLVAVELHQAGADPRSTGLTLTGGGLSLVEEGPSGLSAPRNLARQPGATPFVINSLAGFPIHDFSHLNDGIYGNANSWIGNSGSPGFAGIALGGLFTVNGIAFGRDNTGQSTDRSVGAYTLQYTRVATPATSTPVTGDPSTGWAPIGKITYQATGTGLFTSASLRHRFSFDPVDATGIRLLVPATGLGSGTCIDELEVNPPNTGADAVFGADLNLVTTLTPAIPFTRSTEEWIELYNRSEQTVDLAGWSLSGAVRFQFPAGARLESNHYLVVANDAASLQLRWPEVSQSILGNLAGRLGSGEHLVLRDALGNPANEIALTASGFSDGGGSSWELTDPRADNSVAGAWAASDESRHSHWQSVSYRMIAGQRFGNVLWNEFRVGLLDPGEVLMDDVSVVRNPDGARQQLIQNGDFELAVGNSHWRMLGDHRQSQIEIDPENAENHVLHISSSAAPRMNHNHIESSFVGNTPLVDGVEYEVSYRARWLAGSPQLQTSAYFQKLSQVTILPVPTRHGTPGAVNTRRVANAGPTLRALTHRPILPRTNETVTISVAATDPDGVASLQLSYRVNPETHFTSVAMAALSDAGWGAEIPAQSAGKVVQFYVTALDKQGASSFAPFAGPASRALYQVADTQGGKVSAHELRLIQLNSDRDFILQSTNVMSQELLGGTLIYDRSEVFYDVGVRLHGSAAGRARDGDDYMSYTIAFPPEHLFRGVQSEVNIDRSGRAPAARQQDEIYVLHMFHRVGLPCHSVDLCYFIAPRTAHTGSAILQLGAYGGLFVDEQFNTPGMVFNFDATYEPSVTANGNFEGIKLPVPLQVQLATDFTDLGNDREQYRAPFDLRHGTREDDFSGVIRLCQTLGLPQAEFNRTIDNALAVDEALGVAAMTLLCGIGDIYFTGGFQHNLRIFTPSDGGPAHLLPWDMDFVFLNDATSGIYPPTYNFTKLLSNPGTRRQYLRHLSEFCNTAFNPTYMAPWLAHYGSVVGQNFKGAASYIASRRAFALSQLPAIVPFAITNPAAHTAMINTGSILLTGTGWLDVDKILVSGAAGASTLTWIAPSTWQASVPLQLGNNTLTLTAYKKDSSFLGTSTLSVTTSAANGGTDSDADGMPDLWENQHGLNAFASDGGEDSDRDGRTNLEEYLAGTDPRDRSSVFRVSATLDGAGVHLRFSATAGRSYAVEAQDLGSSEGWKPLAQIPAEIGNHPADVLVSPGSSPGGIFYRIKINVEGAPQ